jgi:hypothetical protein
MRTDRIRCDFPLIEPAHQTLQFHTDDFGKKDRDLTVRSRGFGRAIVSVRWGRVASARDLGP